VTPHPAAGEPLVHQELCFGCGRANLFGLLAELRPAGEGRVAGRCFLKQDHQGPEPGTAHPGIIAAALVEAMSLAGGGRRPVTLELRFEKPVPVGSFLELDASAEDATAALDGRPAASARATWG
jgi:acyl-coenzyme A thioesterase PaaI-like protein